MDDPADLELRLAQIVFRTAAKAAHRTLSAVDASTAHPPFPYDPGFFRKIRADQVPRLLGVLTGAKYLPTKRVPLSSLIAIQDRVDPAKVEKLRGASTGGNPVVARMHGFDYLVDGHHRASAAYLDGDDEIEVHFKDLTDYDRALKGRPSWI